MIIEHNKRPAVSATETQALITRYYDAFNRGDTDGMLACVADDIIHVHFSFNQNGDNGLVVNYMVSEKKAALS